MNPLREAWRYWTRNEPGYRAARRWQVATMGPVFTIAAIYFGFLQAWFIAVVCALAAVFCLWRFKALR